MAVKVIAKRVGFYNGSRRREGATFYVSEREYREETERAAENKRYRPWYTRVEAEAPVEDEQTVEERERIERAEAEQAAAEEAAKAAAAAQSATAGEVNANTSDEDDADAGDGNDDIV